MHRMVLTRVNPAGQRKWLFPHIQHLWACTGSAVSSFRLPGKRQMLTCKSAGGPWWWGAGAHCVVGGGEEERERWVCSALRKNG